MTKPTDNHGFIELHVPDINIAKKFYLLIGFSLVWETDTYAVLKFDGTYIALCSQFNQYFQVYSAETLRGVGVEIVVQVESEPIENLFKTIQLFNEVKIVENLKKQDWGKTDFRIIDPFGYYLRFTEPENILLP